MEPRLPRAIRAYPQTIGRAEVGRIALIEPGDDPFALLHPATLQCLNACAHFGTGSSRGEHRRPGAAGIGMSHDDPAIR